MQYNTHTSGGPFPTYSKSAADDFNNVNKVLKVSNRVENIVAKGEVAHYEQFLLFPKCFSKVVCSIGVIIRLFVGKQKNMLIDKTYKQ